jgi:hypothetical protein
MMNQVHQLFIENVFEQFYSFFDALNPVRMLLCVCREGNTRFRNSGTPNTCEVLVSSKIEYCIFFSLCIIVRQNKTLKRKRLSEHLHQTQNKVFPSATHEEYSLLNPFKFCRRYKGFTRKLHNSSKFNRKF